MNERCCIRPLFQQMLKDTAKRQFEAIIIWKIDRFGRNREEIAFNKYRCKKNGVKVLYTAESIPDTPEGTILEPDPKTAPLVKRILRCMRRATHKRNSWNI